VLSLSERGGGLTGSQSKELKGLFLIDEKEEKLDEC
jgi:hypothetical protein